MADDNINIDPDIENLAGDAQTVNEQLRINDHNIDGRHVNTRLANQYRQPGVYVNFVNYWTMINVIMSAVNAPGFNFSVPERLKHGACLDVYEQMALVPGIIDHLKGEGKWRPDFNLYFAPAYPRELLQDMHGERTIDSPHPKPTSIVTWDITDRDVASNNRQPFTGKTPRKPRYYFSFYIPEDIDTIWGNFTQTYKEELEEFRRVNDLETLDPKDFLDPSIYYGRHILVHSLWFDNIIRFDCFGKTQYESQQLGRYFQDFLWTENGRFMQMGANKSVWWGTINKNKELREESYLNFPYYSFRWYMRTQRFFVQSVPSISSMDVQVNPVPIFWDNGLPYYGHVYKES